MIFLRKYVIIAMGENSIKGFFNTYEDAKEHMDRLNKSYQHKYSSMKIFEHSECGIR